MESHPPKKGGWLSWMACLSNDTVDSTPSNMMQPKDKFKSKANDEDYYTAEKQFQSHNHLINSRHPVQPNGANQSSGYRQPKTDERQYSPQFRM